MRLRSRRTVDRRAGVRRKNETRRIQIQTSKRERERRRGDRQMKTEAQKSERERERKSHRRWSAQSIQQRIVTAQRPLADPTDDLYDPLCRACVSLFLLSRAAHTFQIASPIQLLSRPAAGTDNRVLRLRTRSHTPDSSGISIIGRTRGPIAACTCGQTHSHTRARASEWTDIVRGLIRHLTTPVLILMRR